MKLPSHKCGLYLEHNVHKDYYDSPEKAIEDMDSLECPPDWESTEHKARAVTTDQIWTLQWYPDTPIGSYSIAAPTLEELLEFAATMEKKT